MPILGRRPSTRRLKPPGSGVSVTAHTHTQLTDIAIVKICIRETTNPQIIALIPRKLRKQEYLGNKF